MCQCKNRPAEWRVTHSGGLSLRCNQCLEFWLNAADEFPDIEPLQLERISTERPNL